LGTPLVWKTCEKSAVRLNRLEWRLPAAIAVLLLLVSGTLAALTYNESRRSAVASARARLQHLVTLLGSNFESSAATVRQSSAQLAKDPEVIGVLTGTSPAEPLRKRFASTLQANATTYGIEVWNVAGEELVLAVAASAPEVDPEWNAYPGWAKPDQVVIGPIVAAKQGGAYAIASPVQIQSDGKDQLLGYVVARRRVGSSSSVRDSARLVLDLMGPESRILVGQPDTVWVEMLGQSRGPIAPMTGGADGVYWATDNGTRWLGVSQAIKGTGWHLRIEFPDRVVFAQSKEVLWNTIRIALLVAALGAIGGWVISRRLIRPLRELTEAAAQVADGTEPVRVASRRADEIGQLAAAFNTMAERVTEGRLNLEARVSARTEELARALSQLEEDAKQLARSNRELEAFSYTISHDLRAPLRSIDGFSDALLTDYADQLDETARSHLNRVRRAAKRMGQLIDDLLELSRVSRTELISSPVALETLAARLVRDLRERDPERQVEVIIHPTPPAQGDARLLALVLQNLFENAWKFTARRADARIEFGASNDGPAVTYFVRDNGVGFDMAHSAKLFGIFQRLHSVDEFPGTGVGLAIVQRIVERHGGRIWVEARPDAGATFFFTLEPGHA
jgi:signal transduction histidine kinase